MGGEVTGEEEVSYYGKVFIQVSREEYDRRLNEAKEKVSDFMKENPGASLDDIKNRFAPRPEIEPEFLSWALIDIYSEKGHNRFILDGDKNLRAVE
jgi:hypothetical protein